MNDHQLLCFLTVSRTLNFTSAARELYCTQPALSYQIRSLEQELDLRLFTRSTTRVELTEAGRALLPHAKKLYRTSLAMRTVLKGFSDKQLLRLRLPPVLPRRDPVYPVLMAQLHAALPGYSFEIDDRPVPHNVHHMLCTEADAALYPPLRALPPEVAAMPIMHNSFYLITSPDHPLSGRRHLVPEDLAGQRIFYESLYQELVDFVCRQPGMPFSTPEWTVVESYDPVYTELLTGQGLFLCPIRYPAFPEAWYQPLGLSLPLPDTCLLTLRDDPRPEIETLRQVFRQVCHSLPGW